MCVENTTTAYATPRSCLHELCGEIRAGVVTLTVRNQVLWSPEFRVTLEEPFGYPLGIVQQPFDDDTGINDECHDRPAVRAVRIAALLADGRCRFFSVNCRNNSSRWFCRVASITDTASEVKAIYARRTKGRRVDL